MDTDSPIPPPPDSSQPLSPPPYIPPPPPGRQQIRQFDYLYQPQTAQQTLPITKEIPVVPEFHSVEEEEEFDHSRPYLPWYNQPKTKLTLWTTLGTVSILAVLYTQTETAKTIVSWDETTSSNSTTQREKSPTPLARTTQQIQPLNITHFENCAEFAASGLASLKEGDQGYRQDLDKDYDGIACEHISPIAQSNPTKLLTASPFTPTTKIAETTKQVSSNTAQKTSTKKTTQTTQRQKTTFATYTTRANTTQNTIAQTIAPPTLETTTTTTKRKRTTSTTRTTMQENITTIATQTSAEKTTTSREQTTTTQPTTEETAAPVTTEAQEVTTTEALPT